MRKFNIVILAIILIIVFNSCTASIQKTTLTPNLRLRDYNNIIVNLVSSSGSISYNTVTLGKIDSGQLMTGEKQGLLALQSLQFELMSMGFNFVTKESLADAIVDFYIGAIRYDVISGWIADQAFVKFKDRKTGQILAFYRAKAQVVTPTVNNIISNLSKVIRRNY